jgi:hypothetical protein
MYGATSREGNRPVDQDPSVTARLLCAPEVPGRGNTEDDYQAQRECPAGQSLRSASIGSTLLARRAGT